MNCEWPALTKGSRCVRCGVMLRRDYAAQPVSACKGQQVAIAAVPGLGDQVESLLASVGVTKERYAKAKELFGLPPTCGCESRKLYLNRVSEWWRGQGFLD